MASELASNESAFELASKSASELACHESASELASKLASELASESASQLACNTRPINRPVKPGQFGIGFGLRTGLQMDRPYMTEKMTYIALLFALACGSIMMSRRVGSLAVMPWFTESSRFKRET